MSEWPAEGLEQVSHCPVCRSCERKLMFDGLTDRAFGVAPGAWTLWECRACASAFLDPRPTQEKLGMAYENYYTHVAEDRRIVRRIGRLRTFLHDVVNGYQNDRYGARWERGHRAGRWLLPLLPSLCAAADAECRHLPHVPPSGGRLLDVGCGNGSFLSIARSCGWNVEGVDFDHGAVQAARSRGLDVQHGGIERYEGRCDIFDVITICHVIEHLHAPTEALRQLYKLLKPGGMLWIETPNIESLGSRRYGPVWRGLEPPRHLAIFNIRSLRNCISSVGFSAIKQEWRGLSVSNIFLESESISGNRTPDTLSGMVAKRLFYAFCELFEMCIPTSREFLTIVARK